MHTLQPATGDSVIVSCSNCRCLTISSNICVTEFVVTNLCQDVFCVNFRRFGAWRRCFQYRRYIVTVTVSIQW